MGKTLSPMITPGMAWGMNGQQSSGAKRAARPHQDPRHEQPERHGGHRREAGHQEGVDEVRGRRPGSRSSRRPEGDAGRSTPPGNGIERLERGPDHHGRRQHEGHDHDDAWIANASHRHCPAIRARPEAVSAEDGVPVGPPDHPVVHEQRPEGDRDEQHAYARDWP